MKKLLLVILLFFGASLASQAQVNLETYVLGNRDKLEAMAEIDASQYRLGEIITWHCDVGWLYEMEWSSTSDSLNYHYYSLTLKCDGEITRPDYNESKLEVDNFQIILCHEYKNIFQEMFFGHDENWHGGYYIRNNFEGRQALLNPICFGDDDYVRFMKSEEIESFDSLVKKIVRSYCLLGQKWQEKIIVQKKWEQTNKKVRLERDCLADNWVNTKINFFEKYESDSLLKIINSRAPDSSSSGKCNSWSDKLSYVRQLWYLDSDHNYSISKISNQDFRANPKGFGSSQYHLDFWQGGEKYWLLFDDDFSVLAFAQYENSNQNVLKNLITGRWDYTPQISPRRWLNWGIPVHRLNRAKSEILIRVRSLLGDSYYGSYYY